MKQYMVVWTGRGALGGTSPRAAKFDTLAAAKAYKTEALAFRYPDGTVCYKGPIVIYTATEE